MTLSDKLQDTTILDEAAKVKDVLLKVQAETKELTGKTETDLLERTRQSLGYKESADSAQVKQALIDTRVASKTPVITPEMLSYVIPVSNTSAQTTETSRKAIENILKHEDNRLLVVVGPCSIHDPKAAIEYAEKVKKWIEKYSDNLEIVMRAYMEKPRTELGWKGFVYDPLLDESNDINLGVTATRMISCQITNMGVPIAMERLNALTPQYVNALVAYDVIGARNTTDQKSREYASGTSSPVGFKNTPDGDIESTAQAVVSAMHGHAFLGMGMDGAPNQINSKGNETAHIILRGDNNGPNYSEEHITKVKEVLKSKNLQESIIVDASHGNSGKKASQENVVIADVSQQVATGETAICGVMIESNLVEGNQKLDKPEDLIYGKSITDECAGLDVTEAMLATLSDAADKRSATH
jgi:3-deoxy-7-phosphoheptulonate synthase